MLYYIRFENFSKIGPRIHVVRWRRTPWDDQNIGRVEVDGTGYGPKGSYLICKDKTWVVM